MSGTDQADCDDTLAALLKVLRKLDQEGVLLGVYGIDDDCDAPLDQAVKRWREAGYPLDSLPPMLFLQTVESMNSCPPNPSSLLEVHTQEPSVVNCMDCGVTWDHQPGVDPMHRCQR